MTQWRKKGESGIMEKKDSFGGSENVADQQSDRPVDENKGGIKTMPFILGKLHL